MLRLLLFLYGCSCSYHSSWAAHSMGHRWSMQQAQGHHNNNHISSPCGPHIWPTIGPQWVSQCGRMGGCMTCPTSCCASVLWLRQRSLLPLPWRLMLAPITCLTPHNNNNNNNNTFMLIPRCHHHLRQGITLMVYSIMVDSVPKLHPRCSCFAMRNAPKTKDFGR